MPAHKQAKTITKPKKRSSSPYVVVGIMGGALIVFVTFGGIALMRNTLSPSVGSGAEGTAMQYSENREYDLQGQARGDAHASAFDLLRDAPIDDETSQGDLVPPAHQNEQSSAQSVSPYPEDSWTALYAAEANIEPTAYEVKKSFQEKPEFVREFVARYTADPDLPHIDETNLTITEQGGRDPVSQYLKSISVNHNDNLHPVEKSSIIAAFARATQPIPSPNELDALILTMTSNIETLKKLSVPREAVSLHTAYLAATISLLAHTENLRNYYYDPVGALVSAARIDTLQRTFDEAADLIRELETRYSIN